jgi:hypothetical protein
VPGAPRELPPSSPFAGDDGACAPALGAALAETDAARRVREVVRALASVRVLVPVVAHARPEPGHVSEAAVVTVAGPDGRAVLPVFSCLEAMARWDPRARPIPVEGPRAALAAATDSDGLLVLDPSGPVTVPVPRPAVWALAQGRDWRPAAEDPEVHAAVAAALRALPRRVAVSLEGGRRGDLAVVLTVPPGLDRAGLDGLVAAAGEALARSEVVAERVDSVELTVRAGARAGRGDRARLDD